MATTGIVWCIHVVMVIINSIWNKFSAYLCSLLSLISFSQDSLRYISTKLHQVHHGIKSFILHHRRHGGYLVRGSLNLGGTCFFNAVLQNLLATDVLRDYFLESVDESFGLLSASMRKLFLETSVRAGISEGQVIDPRPLFGSICTNFPDIYSPDKGGYSRKLLKDLVDSLLSEELTSSNNCSDAEASYLDAMFRVRQATVTCLKSGHPSVSYNSRLFLRLEVPDTKPQSKKVGRSSDSVAQPDDDIEDNDISPFSVESCLEFVFMNPKHQTIGKSKSCSKALRKRMISTLKTNFFESKSLSAKQAKNQFNVKRDVAKITIINKAPPVLIIQFEKAMHDSQGKSYTRPFIGRVKFGETLDLKPYMNPGCNDDTCIYRLIGLVEKIIGKKTDHAVAYVRGSTSNGRFAWYHVSDEEVYQVPVEEVLGRKAEILFYERCSFSTSL